MNYVVDVHGGLRQKCQNINVSLNFRIGKNGYPFLMALILECT